MSSQEFDGDVFPNGTVKVPIMELITPIPRIIRGRQSTRDAVIPLTQTEDQCRNDGHLVAFEDIGSHPSAVTHVVANQVSDHGSITGIIFGDILLNFTDQISAHIGGLCIDPPPTRMKRAISVPPKPKPNRASGAALPKMMKITVPPKRPRPSVNMPVTSRVISNRKCFIEAAAGSRATRTLAWMAMRMPN